ncbi:NADH-quinone oxidoreductase subunit M [Hoyosella rhizosphaerae]|uniref:NADH-quinone oxidoreductase subunit M n=1 Tax=Hoyosella rhizosphaerae TaxID=1755582 RepID=A0A916U5B2_9ACTN|nr:NADH-quinone oxidoreductase subunit M [Hoyosella rhizosphaerae]MBN4926213.1 NADH-quinone oxidoreductase subunit M [Hoyosella rhizosphaerae]GGC61181.1 NADH-quinone oxidoreductase subunit M [Hoyosella rhizosphaerae]
MNTLPLLTLLWAVPVIGAAVIMALPAQLPHLAKHIALSTSLIVLALVVVVTVGFDPNGEQYQFVETVSWIPSLGAQYSLGVDGIGLVLVILTGALMPLLLVAAWNDEHTFPGTQKRPVHTYLALMLLVQAMVMVTFTSLDILLFYIFFEAMLIPMYFLIGGFGGPNRAAAAVKFLLYNLLGGLIMLAAVIGLFIVTADLPGGSTFDFRAITAAIANGELTIDSGVAKLLFLGFTFAFAVKAPLWPFHTWLPGAAVQATPASAVLMMAIVDKVGTFAMLRYSLQLFPDAAAYFTPIIITLAVIGIIYGAILAIGQTDIMRLIAYTSISHFGFIILGIFAMTHQSHAGAALYMVNHGIATAALFLTAGFLVSRRGTRAIADFGGIQKVAPIMAASFLIAGLATLSLPGLAPFISEFLVLIGTFGNYPVAAIFATTTFVLAAIYILWTYQRVMTGPLTKANDTVTDLRPREITVVVPLIAALIVLGVFPKPALDVINPAVATVLTTLETTVADGNATGGASQ